MDTRHMKFQDSLSDRWGYPAVLNEAIRDAEMIALLQKELKAREQFAYEHRVKALERSTN